MKFMFFYVIIVTRVLVSFGQDKDKDQCGQNEFYDPSGTIQSPAYPANYPDDSNCVYRILTNRIVNVTFSSFALEQSEDCRYDYIQFVFEATKLNSTPQRYCGDGLAKVNGGTLRGQGPLVVAFKSDESDNLKGFRFTFEFELNGPDPCLSDPCQNGANCSTYPGYYTCACSDGFAGINCEIDKDECLSYPCKNNGNCVDSLNSFSCECIKGFSGDFCEITPDLCLSEPCMHGGLCVDRGLDYVCSCPKDFMGDRCESAVPTPPPKPTTIPVLTTLPATASSNNITQRNDGENNTQHFSSSSSIPSQIFDSQNSTVISHGLPFQKQLLDGNESSASSNSTQDSNGADRNDYPVKDDSALIAVLVVVVFIVLLCLTVVGWYCWKHSRNELRRPKIKREMTVISMKTKSEKGKSKAGRHSSHTTAFNSVTMTTEAGPDKLIQQLAKMSEDVIMEEVTDESLKELSKPDDQQIKNSVILPNDGTVPFHSPKVQKENSSISSNDSNMNNRAFENVSQFQPLCISPEAAVNLLNQMKRNDGENIDFQSSLQHHGLKSFSKNSFPNSEFPVMSNSLGKGAPHSSDPFFQLPNVPVLSAPPVAGATLNIPPHQQEMMELSPEEAAEVVNHFLQYEPSRRKTVDTREALNVIQDVQNKRTKDDILRIDREKSVVVHPQEVADLVNNFHESKNTPGFSVDRNQGSAPESTYELSENEDRHPLRRHREFREYSPIQEESDGENNEVKPSVTTQKRPSRDFGNGLDEPELKRLRKKTKQFPYASTLDPDEKVHDWLKNTPKHKTKQPTKTVASSESITTATHTVITRPLPVHPQTKESQINKIHSKPVMTEKLGGTPHTIRQTRKSFKDNKSSITVTENKAKCLVEKLVKAPSRSIQNVVGPGLGVSRENAFVGECF